MLRELEKCDIKGFNELSKEQQETYRKFILKFIIQFERAVIKPVAINFVKEFDYVYIDKDEDCYVGLGIEVFNQANNEVLFSNIEEDEKRKADKVNVKEYLRFDYLIDDREEWLHVISDKEWY